ncbi:thiamine-phosphate kinase [archaeon SCG-AAA382B04]|nr:thiamine-phosphate kinase [archaeon SCG-AAA382B04]
MKLSDIGENKVIEIIKENISDCESLISEIGNEDCAIIDYSDKKLAYTSDLLTRDRHFPKETPYKDIGWKLIAVNLSDIASMGAKPLFSTTSMGLPDLEEKKLDEITRGMQECSKNFDLCQVGGDITKNEEIILNTSIIGEIEINPLYRKNAQPNQFVAVTNPIGTAGFGIKVIKNNLEINDKVKEKAFKALFQPKPRIKEGLTLSKKPKVAAIDVSDGLSISLKQLSNASGCGFNIQTQKIPFDKEILKEANEKGYQKQDLIDIGDDYELLFTTSDQKLIKKIDAKIIGKTRKKKGIWFDNKRREIRGYRHF